MKRTIRYLFSTRYALVVLLIFIGVNYILSEPTRIIVNATYFTVTVYLLSFFSWVFIKRLFLVKNLLVFFWLVIPYIFLELIRYRYNGGINRSYNVEYSIFLALFSMQGIIWLLSLYPFILVFKSKLQKHQNRLFKQLALEKVNEQIELGKRQPDEGYKACLLGLGQLYRLVEVFPLASVPELFRDNLITAMRQYQQSFTSEFVDDYNSAKASIGSAIINIEKTVV